MFLIILLYFLIATTFIFGKLLLGYVPPVFLIAIRMLIAGSLLLIAYVFMGKKLEFRRRKDYIFLLGASIFHILIPFTTEYLAMKDINASSVCLFYNLSPLISAVMSYFFFKEMMNTKKWIGLMISICGIFYFTNPNIILNPQSILGVPLLAHVFMFASVLTSCLGWMFVRVLVKNRGFSPIFVNGVSMLLGGVFALPLSFALEGRVCLMHIPNKGSFILLLGALILLANFVFYNLYSHLLKTYTATILSFVGLLTPLFVALLEYALGINATISHEFFVAIAIISCGLYIFYQEELRQGYIA